jgi:hypothetical protein
MNAKLDYSDRAECWIPPWTGGPRIITLWDMKEYLAPRLTNLAREFSDAWGEFIAIGDKEEDQTELAQSRRKLGPWCKKIIAECEFLGLQSTKRQAVRLAGIADSASPEEIPAEIEQLERRFDEETEALKIFHVPTDKIGFYNRTDHFGDEFKTNFPQANAEIIEAGNCFAFDRFTSCAYHLMRALEVVLKSLFSTLGLPPLTSVGEKNWNGILKQIRDKLEKDKTIPDYDFYEGAYAFLAAAKNPMRNATMHVDAVYGEDSVRPVFDAVGAFMRHVAKKLKE